MRIHEATRTVVLKLNNPEQVEQVIPSKRVTTRGQEFILAPHNLDSVRVLNNLGFKVPSPILHYYDWPGRYSPYEHQSETSAFVTLHDKLFVLNDIGTGKTHASLWAADYLIQTGVVEKVLIISPLSTLERVWGDSIFTGFPDRDFVILHGAAKRRLKLLKTHVDFYIINHDGFDIIAQEALNMFDLVIVDEAAVFRNPSTKRFRLFKKWIDQQPLIKLWLMTATPTPNEPTDAWALAKLANSRNLTVGYSRFRDMVMMKVGPFKYVPRPESASIVQNILQPAIRFTRSECLDLPKTIIQTRHAEFTPQQRKIYKEMMDNLLVELESEYNQKGTILAVNHAVKVQKLMQIACGVVYDEEGGCVEIDARPRLNLTKEVIEEAGEKVIIFVPLTGVLHMLQKELSKKFTVAYVNGEVSSTKRNIIFRDFQDANDPRVLIAHPKTMSHGLTLTRASTIIWYAPIYSNDQYVQANGRIERIGKDKVSNVVHIEGTELERQMYQRLASKQKVQGLLLDLIQNETR